MSEHNEYQPTKKEEIENIVTEIDHLILHPNAIEEPIYDIIYQKLQDFDNINDFETTQNLITAILKNLYRYNQDKENILQAKEALSRYRPNQR